MKKLFITCLILLATGIINAQESKREYLQKVLEKLEEIESASYTTIVEVWQPGDTAALSIHPPCFTKEYNNPKDTTIGAIYIELDPNDKKKIEFCYDGTSRTLVNHSKKTLVIDDFTARPLPYRPVSPPFYTYTKNVLKYALTTGDNITISLQDMGDNYYFRLLIEEDRQVEFFGEAYHMPKPPFYVEPTSIYEIWIDKEKNLPYKLRREMSHDISVTTVTETELNNLSINDFKASDYYPEDYKIEKYGYETRKNDSSPPSLTGSKAPNWTLNDANGNPVSLADLKSKVLLINFTGIGCGACQAAVPFLKGLKEKFSKEDFELIAIESWSRKEHSVKVYADNKKLNYTILNANDEVLTDYQTGRAAPFFFILDENRIIRKVIRGYGSGRTDKEIMEEIEKLL